ncbi:MAG: redoxin family protein [Desulfobacterales bacterium]|nr:redoxin family protein [Desulfobacterales bacterium]
MKKYFPVFLFFVLGALVIRAGALNYFQPGSSPSIEKNHPIDTLDKLYQDLSIVKIPAVMPPTDMAITDLEENPVKLSIFKGRVVFLNFWASWCDACRVEMPSMEKLHQKFKDKDFSMVAVDLQEPAALVKNFFAAYKLTFLPLLDSNGQMSAAFGIHTIPTTFVLNRQGRVIGKAVGARDWYSKASLAFFEHLVESE